MRNFRNFVVALSLVILTASFAVAQEGLTPQAIEAAKALDMQKAGAEGTLVGGVRYASAKPTEDEKAILETYEQSKQFQGAQELVSISKLLREIKQLEMECDKLADAPKAAGKEVKVWRPWASWQARVAKEMRTDLQARADRYTELSGKLNQAKAEVVTHRDSLKKALGK